MLSFGPEFSFLVVVVEGVGVLSKRQESLKNFKTRKKSWILCAGGLVGRV